MLAASQGESGIQAGESSTATAVPKVGKRSGQNNLVPLANPATSSDDDMDEPAASKVPSVIPAEEPSTSTAVPKVGKRRVRKKLIPLDSPDSSSDEDTPLVVVQRKMSIVHAEGKCPRIANLEHINAWKISNAIQELKNTDDPNSFIDFKETYYGFLNLPLTGTAVPRY
jgi:hypothetical protein